MTAVFVAMVLCAGAGVGVASGLAAYAQRNWTGNRAEAQDA
jgi:hypothetical protein